MTISELFAEVLGFIVDLLGRIILAFARTFNLVTEGKLGDLVLSDLGIVGAAIVVGVVVAGSAYSDWLDQREDHSDDD